MDVRDRRDRLLATMDALMPTWRLRWPSLAKVDRTVIIQAVNSLLPGEFYATQRNKLVFTWDRNIQVGQQALVRVCFVCIHGFVCACMYVCACVCIMYFVTGLSEWRPAWRLRRRRV